MKYSGYPPKNSYLSPKEEILATYQKWSDTYEEDYYHERGCRIPHILTKRFAQYVPTNSQTRVLDAGAGTGYLGKVLHDAGYTSLNLYGIDWCQEMLQHIPREIYVETICADVKKIPYQNDYFDHLISSAVIGLVPKEVFAEFIRVTKPGGYILFNVRDQYYSDDTPFKPEMEALEKKGTWKLVAQKGPLETFANPDFHTLYTFFVYQVM